MIVPDVGEIRQCDSMRINDHTEKKYAKSLGSVESKSIYSKKINDEKEDLEMTVDSRANATVAPAIVSSLNKIADGLRI